VYSGGTEAQVNNENLRMNADLGEVHIKKAIIYGLLNLQKRIFMVRDGEKHVFLNVNGEKQVQIGPTQ